MCARGPSSFLFHRLLRTQASATDSSHTPLLHPLQWSSKCIQGRRGGDLLPSFAPSPLSHAPSHPCFFFFTPTTLCRPRSLTLPPSFFSGRSQPFLPTGASFLLLCSASPGPSVWTTLIAHRRSSSLSICLPRVCH